MYKDKKEWGAIRVVKGDPPEARVFGGVSYRYRK